MSRRDENRNAGIAAALFRLAMLLALLGALFLPSGFISAISALFSGKWGLSVTILAAVVGVPMLLQLAQRARIRRTIEDMDGRVLRLKRLPFWQQGAWPESYQSSLGRGYPWWRGAVYEVEFMDLPGATHRAICRSGFLRGVQWLQELET